LASTKAVLLAVEWVDLLASSTAASWVEMTAASMAGCWAAKMVATTAAELVATMGPHSVEMWAGVRAV
jgi:hypothetical protein